MNKIKITKNSAYKELFYNSNKVVGKYFVIVYKSIEIVNDEKARLNFGITASKKTGNAVKRNWCKRVIRALIREADLVDLTRDLYINIIARKFMISKSFTILKDDFNHCMKKIVMYEKKSK